MVIQLIWALEKSVPQGINLSSKTMIAPSMPMKLIKYNPPLCKLHYWQTIPMQFPSVNSKESSFADEV